MTVVRNALAAALLLAATGCAVSPEQTAWRESFMANRPVCETDRQCEGAWAAARNWVTSNCGMKIDTYTPDLIETYNSVRDTAIACRVTKDPRPEGGYIITVTAGCDYIWCDTNVDRLHDDFNAYVSAEAARFTE